jgi:hypothetical protein
LLLCFEYCRLCSDLAKERVVFPESECFFFDLYVELAFNKTFSVSEKLCRNAKKSAGGSSGAYPYKRVNKRSD